MTNSSRSAKKKIKDFDRIMRQGSRSFLIPRKHALLSAQGPLLSAKEPRLSAKEPARTQGSLVSLKKLTNFVVAKLLASTLNGAMQKFA